MASLGMRRRLQGIVRLARRKKAHREPWDKASRVARPVPVIPFGRGDVFGEQCFCDLEEPYLALARHDRIELPICFENIRRVVAVEDSAQ